MATERERAEAHRVKMEMKRALNEHNSRELRDNPEYLLANLSRSHPEYGNTPVEEYKRKHSL